MAGDGSVQAHLDLSREYLSSARRALEAGETPARFLSIHALELAVKAALVHALGSVPRTHNVGGEFGRHFREKAGADVTRRINKILGDYDAPRYPDWEAPAPEVVRDDLEFIDGVARVLVPRLVRAGS